MRPTISHNALIFYDNALLEAAGDPVFAALILADEAAKFWQLKGTGIDREGGPQHDWTPKPPPDAILTKDNK